MKPPYFVTIISLLTAIFILLIFILSYLIWRNTQNRTDFPFEGGSYQVVTRYKDKRRSAKILDKFASSTEDLFDYLKNNNNSDYKRELIRHFQLFDRNKLRESDPTWTVGHKAMTTPDGEINICIREKSGKIQDWGLIYFVYLHELAHVITPKKYNVKTGDKVNDDHPREFWAAFKFLLEGAVTLNQIEPRDYEKDPDNYNGNIVSYNPFWDSMLDIVLL